MEQGGIRDAATKLFRVRRTVFQVGGTCSLVALGFWIEALDCHIYVLC